MNIDCSYSQPYFSKTEAVLIKARNKHRSIIGMTLHYYCWLQALFTAVGSSTGSNVTTYINSEHLYKLVFDDMRRKRSSILFN